VTAAAGDSGGRAPRGSVELRELLTCREPTPGELVRWGLAALDTLAAIGELTAGDKAAGLVRHNSVINRRLLKDPRAGPLSPEGDRDGAMTLQ
jgi:hypothetical protein